MNPDDASISASGERCPGMESFRRVPWQIWIVVALLAAEGILGNLPAIPQQPEAAGWFAAKCLFIVGLVRGWRWVFALSLLVGEIHVLGFFVRDPRVAVINLVLMLLTASAARFYFPKTNAAVSRARRWLRYSLWTLFLALMAGIAVNWFHAQLDSARQQRAAVEALEKAGPRVKIKYSDPLAPVFRKHLGSDLFREVFAVDASSVHGFNDAHASHLAELPSLVALGLADTAITDAELEHLEGLTGLQYLMLEYTQVTDAGLKHLKGLTQLQRLDLQNTKVTDDGVNRLQQALPHCQIRR